MQPTRAAGFNELMEDRGPGGASGDWFDGDRPPTAGKPTCFEPRVRTFLARHQRIRFGALRMGAVADVSYHGHEFMGTGGGALAAGSDRRGKGRLMVSHCR